MGYRAGVGGFARFTSAGFSILEMLIVISLVGILATIAVPSLVAAQRYHSLRSTAEALVSNFNSARGYAITHNSYARIIFDVGYNSYFIQVYDDENELWQTVENVIVLPANISFSQVTFENGIAIFDPFGSLKAGGQVEIVDSFGNSILMSTRVANGQLRIEEGG